MSDEKDDYQSCKSMYNFFENILAKEKDVNEEKHIQKSFNYFKGMFSDEEIFNDQKINRYSDIARSFEKQDDFDYLILDEQARRVAKEYDIREDKKLILIRGDMNGNK
jgi:hypothetical protein